MLFSVSKTRKHYLYTDVSVRYTGSTLAVSGNEVHFNLEFGTAIVDATCQVLRGNRVQASANCN